MKSYVLIQDYRAPYVVATGHPRNPQSVMFKSFKRGDIIKGELKHSNNQPAFVLVAGTLVVPLSVIKEVTTKEISSGASGESTNTEATTEVKKVPNKKLRYVDAVVIGGVIGFGAMILAEKQGWLPEGSDMNKMKLYGVIGGIAAGAYLVFRNENKVAVKPKTNE